MIRIRKWLHLSDPQNDEWNHEPFVATDIHQGRRQKRKAHQNTLLLIKTTLNSVLNKESPPRSMFRPTFLWHRFVKKFIRTKKKKKRQYTWGPPHFCRTLRQWAVHSLSRRHVGHRQGGFSPLATRQSPTGRVLCQYKHPLSMHVIPQSLSPPPVRKCQNSRKNDSRARAAGALLVVPVD